jgi:hypothetical protein
VFISTLYVSHEEWLLRFSNTAIYSFQEERTYWPTALNVMSNPKVYSFWKLKNAIFNKTSMFHFANNRGN